MKYMLVEFTKGLNCQAYQEINADGFVVRYLDLDGNELVLPKITESRTISDDFVQVGFNNV